MPSLEVFSIRCRKKTQWCRARDIHHKTRSVIFSFHRVGHTHPRNCNFSKILFALTSSRDSSWPNCSKSNFFAGVSGKTKESKGMAELHCVMKSRGGNLKKFSCRVRQGNNGRYFMEIMNNDLPFSLSVYLPVSIFSFLPIWSLWHEYVLWLLDSF